MIDVIHQLRDGHARPAHGFVGIGPSPRSAVAGLMNEMDEIDQRARKGEDPAREGTGGGPARGQRISCRPAAQEMGCLRKLLRKMGAADQPPVRVRVAFPW